MRAYRATPEGRQASREASKKYAAANAPKVRQKVREWKAANPEAVKAWRENNRPRLRVYESRSQAKRVSAPGSFTPDDLQAQFNAQDGKCFYCEKPLVCFHIEHKIPLARGGTNFPDNIVCACARCNLRKGPRTADEFFAILRAEQSKVA